MKITSLDIRRKEFKRSVRGYADEEVDLFLDEVADGLEQLAAENTELVERLRKQEEQLAGNQQLREALEKTLITAQLQADQTRAQARKDAEQIIRDAEYKAQGVVEESDGELQKVQQALLQLKQLEEDFRSKFQSLLQSHLRVLAEVPLDIPVAQPVMVPVVQQTVPAAEPAAVPEPDSAPVAAAPVPGESPFVVPDTFEAVPEYSSNVTTQPVVSYVPESIVAATPPQDAPIFGSAPEDSAADTAMDETSETVGGPARLLWPEETGETQTTDPGNLFPTVDDTNTSVLDAPTVISDDSVTLIGEDPLQGFFFSSTEETGADGPSSGKSGRSKPRDFEW